MKEKLKSVWYYIKDFYEFWIQPVFAIVGVVVTVFSLFFILVVWQPFKQPEHCRLHEFVPMNAVCLVDTHSGDVGELRVYPPHGTVCNAIEEKDGEEPYGYFTMSNGRRYHVMSNPDNNCAEVTIDGDFKYSFNEFISGKYFCKDCLQDLEDVRTAYPLMLADMYELEDIKLYPLALGATYNIRHYTVVIEDTLTEAGDYKIEITSSYYDGGKALDY